MRRQPLALAAAIWLLTSVAAIAQPPVTDPPLAEKYLTEGKLAEGARALEAALAKTPADDQARFGLGITQFLQSFEKLTANLYRYGLRTERTFLRINPDLRELLKQNPKPEKLAYQAARDMVRQFSTDIAGAEKTLAAVKDESVKLPLSVGKFQIAPFGADKPVGAAFLLRIQGGFDPEALKQVESFSINFDRGDVCWLRGYCHLLMAWSDVLLAVDGQDLFNCGAHVLFENVETPYPFLLEHRTSLDAVSFDRPEPFMDLVAFLHLSLRLKIGEPARLKSAHAHLKAALSMSREMWTHFNKETDDDRELIPSPKQTGAAGVPVSAEVQKAWLSALDEFEAILDGKKLIPFWRPVFSDAVPKKGVNVYRAIQETKEFDLILWIQGTAATPYLEEGEMTPLSNRDVRDGVLRPFGGNFWPFMFWFN